MKEKLVYFLLGWCIALTIGLCLTQKHLCKKDKAIAECLHNLAGRLTYLECILINNEVFKNEK